MLLARSFADSRIQWFTLGVLLFIHYVYEVAMRERAEIPHLNEENNRRRAACPERDYGTNDEAKVSSLPLS